MDDAQGCPLPSTQMHLNTHEQAHKHTQTQGKQRENKGDDR